MRKILIAVLLILLIILAYFTIFQGISIGAFNLISTKGIANLNDELALKIEVAKRKIDMEMNTKQEELQQNVKELLKAKETYYDLANVSTENEISEANTEEVYTYEYLCLRIGGYARNEGVNMKMDIKEGDAGDEMLKNISFSVTGKYTSIIDFISSIEDDSELSFRISNFNMLPSGDNLVATFDVDGIRIKLDKTTATVDTPENANTNEVTQTNDVANTNEVTNTNEIVQ